MSQGLTITRYAPAEERINVISHAMGIVLSCVATVLLVVHAARNLDVWHIVSFSIFGTTLITLYTASTLYHHARTDTVRKRLKVFDHAAIFTLIAGTYTPFTLVTLRGTTGWVIFGITWGIAITGIILKLFFTGRFKIVSTTLYVGMGWIIVFAIKPLLESLPQQGILWIFIGGLAYTTGAVIYSIRSIRFNHAIFHIFVLAGSISHFVAIYFFV